MSESRATFWSPSGSGNERSMSPPTNGVGSATPSVRAAYARRCFTGTAAGVGVIATSPSVHPGGHPDGVEQVLRDLRDLDRQRRLVRGLHRLRVLLDLLV